MAPAATVERLLPLLPALGITRLADITGLDHVGLPVFVACRPNSRSLSVSQGKGLTRDAARASALMEAIELYHAERIELPLRLTTHRELRCQAPVVDVDGLPRLQVSAYHDALRLLWIEGADLLGGEPRWLPYELVHMDTTLPLPPGSGCFALSSNGLASGNHPVEALLHALCEVVERDAASLWDAGGSRARAQTRVDPATVDDDDARRLLDRLEQADMAVGIWDITSDVAIAAFHAIIVDARENPGRILYSAAGMGCHPSRGVALCRALTEAAQSRLTMISSSRDDVLRRDYETSRSPDVVEAVRRELRETSAPRSFRDAPHHDGATIAADLAWALERLADAGIAQAVAVDLTRSDLEIPVVRVVVPGLEGVHTLPGYVPGARARRRTAGSA